MGNVEGIERYYGTNVSSTNVTFALKINDNPVQNDVTAAHKGANTWNHFIYNHTYTSATQTEAVEAYLNGELIGTYSVTLATAAGGSANDTPTHTYAIQTNNGVSFINSSLNATLLHNGNMSLIARFKSNASIADNQRRPFEITLSDGSLLYTVGITRETNGNLGFQTKNQRFDGGEYFDVNKWYTTVLTIEDTSRLQGFINGTLVTNATETTSLNGFTTMTRLFVNENDPFLAEIDYIVMVPNALTEAQMTSLYSTYSQGADIETFLSDNSLTPTVKYTFENDNTNTGTATGLPAISFQATDTYSAESIEKYQVWMYMLSPDGVGGAGDHNVLTNIFMYDTHDAWPGSGGINTENENRLSYTIDESSGTHLRTTQE